VKQRASARAASAGLRRRVSPVELDAGILAPWLADAVLAARLKWDNKLDQAA
jgi:hypothetical protein